MYNVRITETKDGKSKEVFNEDMKMLFLSGETDDGKIGEVLMNLSLADVSALMCSCTHIRRAAIVAAKLVRENANKDKENALIDLILNSINDDD